MSKEKEIIDIISLYDSILESKSINEVATLVMNYLVEVMLVSHRISAHGGQSGWQSALTRGILNAIRLLSICGYRWNS